MHDEPYKVASGKKLWLVNSFYRARLRSPSARTPIDVDTHEAETEVVAVRTLEKSRNRIAGPGDDRPDVRHGRLTWISKSLEMYKLSLIFRLKSRIVTDVMGQTIRGNQCSTIMTKVEGSSPDAQGCVEVARPSRQSRYRDHPGTEIIQEKEGNRKYRTWPQTSEWSESLGGDAACVACMLKLSSLFTFGCT